MNRQEFIKKCGVYCLGPAGLSFILDGCSSSYYYAQHTLDVNKLIVKKSEFIFKQGEVKTSRTFVLVKNDRLEFPICLYRFDESEFVALYTKCAHQGCEVQPHNDYLVCPCHGSEYSNHGKVINPPAENDLQQFKVTSDLENIFILL